MCGIAGIFNFNGESVEMDVLRAFTDSMAHRGPDGAGYEIMNNGSLGLGHRRLSILDLTEAGHQPFFYMDRYCIVYNGEVYNFNQIKDVLITKGYVFHSNTDTEVVVAAYDYYGMDCFNHFNGMWAFAIWDSKENKLVFSRDRYGVKPLYYGHVSEQTFAFASETRAFKFLRGFKRSINQNHYELTLKNNYALEGLGYTIFNHIYQLLPGHYMEIKDSMPVAQKRWYDIRNNNKPSTVSKEEQQHTFYDIFRDACRIRLISDVPVATALSGGLDSSSIYSTVFDIIQNENNERINKNSQLAVSAIFPGMIDDERVYAEKAITFTNGKIKWVTTDASNLATDIIRQTELFDAICNTPITAISSIYKGMKGEGITVSLDGHGVDEMLYGYIDMVYNLWLSAMEECNKLKATEYAEILAGLYHPDFKNAQLEVFKKEISEKITLLNLIKSKIKKVIGRHSYTSIHYLPVDLPSLSDKPYNFEDKPIPERMLYYEFFQNSLPTLLRNFDRSSMMNSVEIRMPFMDYRLVEYLFSLPIESKIGKGYTKKILREVMKNRMDESIRCRTHKIGIGSPFQFWADHFLKDWLYDKVNALTAEDKPTYKLLLDQYFKTGNQSDLESIWIRINRAIIEG